MQISYCTEYSDYGCCWGDADREARQRAMYFLLQLGANLTLANQCRPYLKNISCISCNPYAAHIYDVEGGEEARTFPWLCRSYCELAYQHCNKALLQMFNLSHSDYNVSKDPATNDELIADSQRFCSQVITSESPYCYPKILNGPNIKGSFSSTPTGDLGCVCLKPIATRLRRPNAIKHSGDGTGRLFIIEQIGIIRILTANNTLLRRPFLNIRGRVYTFRGGDERGLLGLAFHPNYTENGKFYVCYTLRINRWKEYSIVSEFTVTPSKLVYLKLNQTMIAICNRYLSCLISLDDPNLADASSERELLRVHQPTVNHNAGDIFFQDGYLFVSLGDGGGAGDPFNAPIGHGQDKLVV